jgi:hypothetical protein
MNILDILYPDNTKRNDKDEIELDEKQTILYKALHELRPGTLLSIKSTEHSANPITGNTKIGIYADDVLLGHVPHLSALDKQLAFVTNLLKEENLKSLSIMYPALYELKITNSKRDDAFKGNDAVSRYLLNLFGMPNTALKSEEFKKEFNKNLNELLNLTVRQDRGYVTYKDTTVEQLRNSYTEWRNKLVADRNYSISIRLGLQSNASLSYQVQNVNTGDIQFLPYGKNGKTYQLLTALDKVENTELLDITKGSSGASLESKVAGSPSNQPHRKAEGFKSGMGFTTVEGFGFTGEVKTRIPVPLHRSSFTESYGEKQADFNKKAPDVLYEMIMNYVNLQPGADLATEHRKIANVLLIFEKKEYISFNYGYGNLMTISKSKYGNVNVTAYDKDGQPIVFTDEKGEPIVSVNARGESVKYLLSTNSYFKSIVTNAIKQANRNVKYSIDSNQEFTFGNNKYTSYKHFLIETGAVVTDVTNVVDSNGKKLGNVGVKGKHRDGFMGRSLKIMVAPLSMQHAKDVKELYDRLFAANNELSKWKEVFDLASSIGVSLDWTQIATPNSDIDGIHPMQVRGNVIWFYKAFTQLELTDINNSLLVVHEMIHPIVNEAVDRLTEPKKKEFKAKLVAYNTALIEATKDYNFENFNEYEQEQIKMIPRYGSTPFCGWIRASIEGKDGLLSSLDFCSAECAGKHFTLFKHVCNASGETEGATNGQ